MPASFWTVSVRECVFAEGWDKRVCECVCTVVDGSAQVEGPPCNVPPMRLLPARGSSAPEPGTPTVCNCMDDSEGVVCCKACSHALKCSNEGRAPAQSGLQGPLTPPLSLLITRDPMLSDSCVFRRVVFTWGEAALQGVGGVNLTIIAARAPFAVPMPSRLGETWTMSSVGHPQSTPP